MFPFTSRTPRHPLEEKQTEGKPDGWWPLACMNSAQSVRRPWRLFYHPLNAGRKEQGHVQVLCAPSDPATFLEANRRVPPVFLLAEHEILIVLLAERAKEERSTFEGSAGRAYFRYGHGDNRTPCRDCCKIKTGRGETRWRMVSRGSGQGRDGAARAEDGLPGLQAQRLVNGEWYRERMCALT